jgi:serine/threonine protein kinase/Tfp pilus assembly protein PilF
MLKSGMETMLAGHYQIVSSLGSGGFGQTFLARDDDRPENPLCVIKKLKPRSSDPDTLRTAKRLFDCEAQTLARLGDHDRIPRLLDHFEHEGEFYLVQEYIEGQPLDREIPDDSQLGEPEVMALLQDILQVLVFVHGQNVIHRDIKPANLIRRSKDGQIVLIDFGAVKEVSTQSSLIQGQTTLTVAIGSPGYMPNEQMAGAPRYSSDVYAVGIIGIRALTGVSPKYFKTDPQTSEIRWRDRAPHVSREFAAVLDRMVRYDFRDRYPSALQALQALQNLHEGVTQPMSAVGMEETEFLTEEDGQQSPTETFPPAQPRKSPPPSRQDSPTPVDRPPVPRKKLSPLAKGWRKARPMLTIAASVSVTFLVTWRLLPPRFIEQTVYQTIFEDPVLVELLDRADRQRQAGDYQNALASYDKAIARNPRVPEVHWGRCYSLNELGRLEAALAACERALTLKPEYPEALSSQGYALTQQQQYEEALQRFDEALALNPDFAEAWVNKGVALQALDRHEKALAAFEEATNLQPNYAQAWANRGAALWSLERYREAIASLDKALELQPDNPNANRLREQARRELGR